MEFRQMSGVYRCSAEDTLGNYLENPIVSKLLENPTVSRQKDFLIVDSEIEGEKLLKFIVKGSIIYCLTDGRVWNFSEDNENILLSKDEEIHGSVQISQTPSIVQSAPSYPGGTPDSAPFYPGGTPDSAPFYPGGTPAPFHPGKKGTPAPGNCQDTQNKNGTKGKASRFSNFRIFVPLVLGSLLFLSIGYYRYFHKNTQTLPRRRSHRGRSSSQQKIRRH
eukprot:GHVP01065946.1.p1 GENE.GHVP01065946.1~~GHVP01065946.1.p1  ORF type:complete len:220 (-),score=40.67 GHVP01065946.1:46-705(-)